MDVKELFENLSLPVVAAPMFLVSGTQLVAEACKNGIIGTFPSLNQRTAEGFEEWVIEIKNELNEFERETGKKASPFGVNLIAHDTNTRLKADLEICVRHQVPIICTSLGIASKVVEEIHNYGGLVFHDVTNKPHAERAIRAGVDGLILVSAGAGGHGGLLNPMPFIAEIRSIFDGLILLSGCISNGRDIASALQMGADLAYMGTRFINTEESLADEAYKQLIIESGTQDIVYTAAVSGVPANFLRDSLKSVGITKKEWNKTEKIDFGKEFDEAGAKAWKTIWSAGQGVANINNTLPLHELLDELKTEFIQSIKQQQNLLKKFGS